MNVRTVVQKALTAGISALLLAQTAIAPVAADVSADASAATSTGNRINWQGGQWYLNGANIPWFSWGCDFGCGARGGVSDPAVRQQLDPGFAQMAASGIRVARWWVFEGEGWQITRDASGAPAGLDPRVFEDMDAAVALAEKHNLFYSFTLFHGPSNIPASWMSDPAQRAKLVQALTPLFARYKDSSRILAWDVINEPEWDIWQGKADQAAVQALVKDVAAAVHGSSRANVTVGSAMIDGLPLWKGLGLDYYQAHWYDYMNKGDWCARCTDYAAVQQRLGLDKPLIIGEFYAGKDTDAAGRLADWRAKGFAGAYAWSFFADKTQDKLGIDLDAVRAFAGQYDDTRIAPANGVAAIMDSVEPVAAAEGEPLS